MLNRICALIIVCVAIASSAYGATVEGVNVPDSMMVGNEKLILNGAGVRVKKLVGFVKKDVYVAGLYLKEKNSDAQQVINADETMALRIKIVTSLVTSERFSEHAKQGFEESTNGNTAPIQKEINQFLNTFSDKIENGDLFEIVYKKGVGVQTFKNGGSEPIVTIVGMPVKSALFGIWLGKRTEVNLQHLADELMDLNADPK